VSVPMTLNIFTGSTTPPALTQMLTRDLFSIATVIFLFKYLYLWLLSLRE